MYPRSRIVSLILEGGSVRMGKRVSILSSPEEARLSARER